MDQSPQKQNPELTVSENTTVKPVENSLDVNVGAVADVDGSHSEFAPANAGYSINSGSPSATTEPAKRSWKDHLIDEIKEVGLVMGYLAISFSIIQTFRCATILAKCSENDFLTSYGTACVSAVVLGKFVFVIEKMRISKRFSNRPLIVPVLYKTALFTVAANLLMHLEARFLHHGAEPSSASANPVPPISDPLTFSLCFFAHQLAIVVTFFIFFTFRDIARVLGRGRLKRMFFVSIE